MPGRERAGTPGGHALGLTVETNGGHTTERRLPLLAVQACLLLASAIVLVLTTDRPPSDGLLRLLGQTAGLQLVAQTAILRRRFGSVIAPPVIFAILLSLFTSGWLLLRALNIEVDEYDILSREDTGSLILGTRFYLLAFPMFCSGAVLAGARIGGGPRAEREATRLTSGLIQAGHLCIAVGLLPYVLLNANNVAVVFSRGYSAYYEDGSRLDGPLVLLGYYFVVGLVFLAVAASPRRARRAVRILVAVGLIRLIAGDRGEGTIYLLAALMISQYRGFRSPSNRRDLVRAVATAALLSLVIPAIGALRHGYGGGEPFRVRESLLAANPIAVTLNTIGTTMYPLVKVIEATGSDQPLLHGGSYVSGIGRLLPEWILPGWLNEPLYASPGVWLQDRMGLSYGPGFTPFAEAYLNFGYIGGAVSLLGLGLLSTRALTITRNASPARGAFAFGVFVLTGFAVRGSFNYVIPQVVRYVCLPLVAAMMLGARYGARLRQPSTISPRAIGEGPETG